MSFSRKVGFVVVSVIVLGLVGWLVFSERAPRGVESSSDVVEVDAGPMILAPAAGGEDDLDDEGRLIGERVLAGFHDPGSPPVRDLVLVRQLFANYQALVKSHADRPVGCNGDLVDVLLGKNPYKQRFLPDDYRFLNDEGELMDRWGKAIWVHPVSGDLIELRSAGVDGILFNEDDVVLE